MADQSEDNKIILGMVMLKDENSFDVEHFIRDYHAVYKQGITKTNGDSGSFVCTIDGETVLIGHMTIPIPASDIEWAAKYAYNWQNALEDTKKHKSHLIVSLMKGGNVARFKIFTQVLCSLLRTTNAIGIYQGSQSLLTPKADYLDDAEAMSDEYLPLNLWVFFGLRETEKGNAGYTYGLKEFNKVELEIVDSSKSLEDIREFLFNVAHYVLEYNITLREGQTIGSMDGEEKILLSFSKGKFVDGDTLKIAY